MIRLPDAPTISMNDDPLGRLLVDSDGVRWAGPLAWYALHGEHGRSLWMAGKMVELEGVSMSGVPGTVSLKPGDPHSGTWRLLGDDGRTWIHGDVSVTADGLVFIPGRAPTYKWKTGTMPGELHRAMALLREVDDFDFAGDVYGALCSLGWHNEQTGKQYWGSWKTAGEVVASMRGRFESYTDFFLMGNEGMVTAEVRDAFQEIGWTCIGQADVPGRQRRAGNILETCEARAISETPEWYRHWSTGFVVGQAMGNRMHMCAISGRVALDEWNLFWEYLLEEYED